MSSVDIHPSSVVDPKAKLGEGVKIGPFCLIGPEVVLGDRVHLKSHVVVQGNTVIGEDTVIWPFAAIGVEPQDLKYRNEPSRLEIGARNRIREHVTMHPGTEGGGMLTKIGNDCLFMVGVHIAHDCIVGNHVIMANNATLGGHVVVGDRVLLGGLCAVHQFCRVGSHAVVGGLTAVDSDIIPYGRAKGGRATLSGLNLIGLERQGYDRKQIRAIQHAIDSLFEGEGTLEDRLNKLEAEHSEVFEIQAIIDFARKRDRFPLCAPDRKQA